MIAVDIFIFAIALAVVAAIGSLSLPLRIIIPFWCIFMIIFILILLTTA